MIFLKIVPANRSRSPAENPADCCRPQIERLQASGEIFLKNLRALLPLFRFPQAFHAIKILPLDPAPPSLFRSFHKRP
jgi:hypothetical protein